MPRYDATIPRAILTLSTMPDFTVSLSTLSDAVDYRNSRWRPPLLVSMAAILNFGSQPSSDKDDRVISKSGMVENMGVKVGIAAPSLTVQKLFLLPV